MQEPWFDYSSYLYQKGLTFFCIVTFNGWSKMKSLGHQMILWWVIAGIPLGLAILFYFVDDIRIQILGVGFFIVLTVYQVFLSRLMRSHADADRF
jgi:hypothetical protein